jgi:hypothetical protein
MALTVGVAELDFPSREQFPSVSHGTLQQVPLQHASVGAQQWSTQQVDF